LGRDLKGGRSLRSEEVLSRLKEFSGLAELSTNQVVRSPLVTKVSWHEFLNLLGEVLHVILNEHGTFKGIADGLLVEVLGLEIGSLVLAFGELLLELRSWVLLDLLLEVSSLINQVF